MKRTLLAPSLLLLLLGAACYRLTVGGAPGRGAIVFCEAGQIHTLDPAKMTWMQDIRAALALWQGLVRYNPRTLAPLPGIARSWRISSNRLTYTFYLRRRARWSNGAAVTANDFLFAWKRMLHPATGAGYVMMLFHIAGAKAYFDSLARHPEDHLSFATVGARALGRRTLVVHLAHPCTYFLDLLAFPPFFPLNARSMQPFAYRRGRSGGYQPRWTRPPHLVTDGPYKLIGWKFHQYLLLRPNPYFWDRRAVRCRRLLIANYPDAESAFLAYQSGAVDVLSFVPSDFAHALLREQRLGQRDDVHDRLVFGSYYYLFNCRHKPLNNPQVRIALALAINKREIVRDVTRLPERPLNVLVPPGSIPGYRSPRGLSMNIAAARKLLAAAGYPDGHGLRRLKFLTDNAAAINGRIAQAVQEMWRKELGVRIRINEEETKVFHQDMVHGNYDIASAGWYGDYMDPTTWLDLFRTGNPNNLSGFSSRRYDSILQRAGRTVHSVERFALLRRAEKLLVEKYMPAIPLFQACDGLMYHAARIGGLSMNVRMITLLQYIHWRRNRKGIPAAGRTRIQASDIAKEHKRPAGTPP